MLLALGLWGCSEEVPLTQVVVTVDSDLDVPADIDSVTVDVMGLVRPAMASADLTVQALPRSLSLVHDGGAYGPLVVTARALSGSTVVVERQAEFSFARERTVTLLMELASACAGVECTGTNTCSAGTCVARTLGPLPPFEGVIQGGVFAAIVTAGTSGGGGSAGTTGFTRDAGSMP